jgi:hypothetical protein
MRMGSDDFFLFVSHVTEDRAAASQVVEELERRGVRCWIAPRNVRPGMPFDDDIADAIESCRAMLLIFSSRCNESEYIRREITVAGNASKRIIPFRIENAEPKRGLSVRLADLHWIDAFVAKGRAIDEVVRSVRPSSAGPPPHARWTPPPKAQPTSTLALPWTPVKTLRGARVLTLVGASWFGLMALKFAGIATLIALERRVNWEAALILNSVFAVLFGGCAVGTYFNRRVASLVGFALVIAASAPAMWFAASYGAMSAELVVTEALQLLPAIAGILGTSATARLLSTGAGHRQGSTA